MELFDRNKLKILPLSYRKSKTSIENIVISPDGFKPNLSSENKENIESIANRIIRARRNNASVILAFGAHLIKNGLGLVLRNMINEGFITHLATNGAGSIHDWEFAYKGETEEDVEYYIKKGQFGIWYGTGKYLNLAVISGAFRNKGYGESIGEMIFNDNIKIPENLNNKVIRHFKIKEDIKVKHDFKRYSVQEAAFRKNIPFTIHPGFGYDIIYSSPYSDGASIGKASEIDFLGFVNSVSKLEKGVYLSVGSAIMSPMILEKSLSMARNLANRDKKKIEDFLIAVNDIKGSTWDFSSNAEPPKNHPAYYDRLCKSFKRMGSKELQYIQADNRDFLVGLYNSLKSKRK